MVLVNVGSGSRSVYVRVDDLALAEREQVHGAVDAVRRIVNRDESPSVAGIFTAFIVCCVIFIAIMAAGSNEEATVSLWCGVAAVFVPGFLLGGLTWYTVGNIVAAADHKDGERLQHFVAQSPRAREFVAACRDQSTLGMAKKMAVLVPLPAPAA